MSAANTTSALRYATSVVLCGLALAAAAQPTPRVASINLCADQLVLSLARPEQIATVSWLAADPEESMLAEQAARFPLNFGSAEELLRFAPDVVVAGTFTNAATVNLMTRLGYRVILIEPAQDVAGIEANLHAVAEALGNPARAADMVADMHRELARLEAFAAPPLGAVVVRPGGFTIGRASLADHLLTRAGLRNMAAEQGLDRWGSLSVETLVSSTPDLLIVTAYRRGEASLANAFFDHPALTALLARLPTTTVAAKYWACGLPESLHSIELMQQAAGRLP
jgi:iron complex transport system substrate-binding protein